MLSDGESILDSNAKFIVCYDPPSAYLTEDAIGPTVTVAIQDTPEVGIVSIPLIGVAGHAESLEVADVVRATFRPWNNMIDV